jgi:hypothetical protein
VDYTPDQWLALSQRVAGSDTIEAKEAADRLHETFKNQVWPSDLSKAPRTWDGSETVESQLKEWVPTVIKELDPMHGEYDGVPALAALNVQKEIEDSLTQPQGWSINSVAKRLQTEFDWMSTNQAERIARMEVAAVLNTSKSVMLRAAEPSDQLWKYVWDGPEDSSTSKICEEIKEEVTARGGEVPLGVMEDILYEKARKYDDKGGTPHRVEELLPHFGCRHTITAASTPGTETIPDATENNVESPANTKSKADTPLSDRTPSESSDE